MSTQTFRCDQCDHDVIPVEGVTAIYRRGHWWCVEHCRTILMCGVLEVDFPSVGKMVPRSIFADEIDGGGRVAVD